MISGHAETGPGSLAACCSIRIARDAGHQKPRSPLGMKVSLSGAVNSRRIGKIYDHFDESH
jgi:hypothetical protein